MTSLRTCGGSVKIHGTPTICLPGWASFCAHGAWLVIHKGAGSDDRGWKENEIGRRGKQGPEAKAREDFSEAATFELSLGEEGGSGYA